MRILFDNGTPAGLQRERVRVVVIYNFNWPIGAEGIAGIRAAIEQAEPGTPIFLNL